MEADERHHNPMGTLHGGIYCDLADAAMGYAYAATLGEDETFTTIELKSTSSEPCGKGELIAESRKRTALWDTLNASSRIRPASRWRKSQAPA